MTEKRDGGSSRFATFFVSLGEQYFRSSEALCGLSSRSCSEKIFSNSSGFLLRSKTNFSKIQVDSGW